MQLTDSQAPPISHIPRVPFYRSFLVRSLAFFILSLVLVSAGQLYVLSNGLRDIAAEIDQAQYWDSAAELAGYLQAHVIDELDTERVQHVLTDLSILAPSVEVYLLDNTGAVRAHFPQSIHVARPTISLTPVLQALEPLSPELPLYGEDPSGVRPAVLFAAAPITLEGVPGYVYVVLHSQARELLTRTIGQYYILESSIGAAAVVTLCAWLLSALFYFYFGRRFRRLTSVLERYRHGDLTARAVVDSPDEIGQMASTLNEMANTIEQTQKALEQRDTLRRELVADIVHDMRSPLTALKATLERYFDNTPQQETFHDRDLRILYEATAIQNSMVDDLFELSRIDVPEPRLELDDISLELVAQRAVAQFQVSAEKKGVTLVYIPAGEHIPAVAADHQLVARAVANLIDNALRHTPEGGRIEVQLERNTSGSEEAIELTVSDTGAGFADIQLAMLTTRGVKDPKTSRGLGIGLTIVKKIIDLHQWQLRIESGEGSGSRFSILTYSRK